MDRPTITIPTAGPLAAQPSPPSGLNAAASPVPWLKPGVVMHDPSFPVDRLLADFARAVQGRGFAVKGFVQCNHQPGEGAAPHMDLMDLSNGKVIRIDQHAGPRGAGIDIAVDTLRRALHEPTDLVVVGRFVALERAGRALGDAVRDGLSTGFPVLTSVAARCMAKWQSFSGREGTLLPANETALWRWWGPDRLYPDLVHGVVDGEVRRIVVGPRWLMVEGERGTGLAHLSKGGDVLRARAGVYRRRGLRGLAALAHGWDPAERALAVAAINASYNRRDMDALPGDGLDDLARADGRTVLIGAIPGYRDRMPRAQVVESNPRDGEFPMAAAECLLPGCTTAILSAAGLVNRTLPRLLSLACPAHVALTGPATPLTPRLHAYGVGTLAGFVVTDPDGLANAIAQGDKPWAFAPFGRVVHRRSAMSSPMTA
ncbi:hypothetical protein FBZ84_12343 [Azospirillum baldaniorum]|uniref:DUF2478 domain-containing protein n=1 Tax=Azospirillum baldaniorum TaxID=1064539 RepID=UPI0011A1C29C|nr:DUF2478 domain-containing protein [Azospirillum baldaniorum]TWA56440.1 hypothetical protein FBZ84_12343 [Azospirillum baldaniorum]